MNNDLALARTVLRADIAGSSSGEPSRQQHLDGALTDVLGRVLDAARRQYGPWHERLDGDSFTLVADPSVPKGWIATDLIREFEIELERANRHVRDEDRLRLRMGIADGQVTVQMPHMSGDAVRLAARIEGCTSLRDASDASGADLTVALSDGFYTGVVPRRERGLDPDQFRHVADRVKDGVVTCWIRADVSRGGEPPQRAPSPASPPPPSPSDDRTSMTFTDCDIENVANTMNNHYGNGHR